MFIMIDVELYIVICLIVLGSVFFFCSDGLMDMLD